MKTKHSWHKNEINKEARKDFSFLLTNRLGGYFSLPGRLASRYHGWFFTSPSLAGKKMFKLIENIELVDAPKVSEVSNNFWNIERKRGNINEAFFLPSYYNSLVYELSEPLRIDLFLDAKESYDNQKFGISYEISEEKELIIIKCQNNEDAFYLAIKMDTPLSRSLKDSKTDKDSEKKLSNYSKIKEWVLRHYQLDKERNSFPFERYVYHALRINAQKVVFSVSSEKEKAIQEAQEVFEDIENLKEIEKERIKILFDEAKEIVSEEKCPEEIRMAYFCAQNSLNNLVVGQDERDGSCPCAEDFEIGIYAGLPWFFQFWARDELISLKPLNEEIQKDILFKRLNDIKETSSSDALGWLFQRVGKLSGERRIKKTFLESIDKLNAIDASVTWMDTLRRPRAIELYASQLNIYRLAQESRDELKYSKLEEELRKETRDKFWNGEILADTAGSAEMVGASSGESDFTVRPNIFLAAYIYPELLSKKEWIKCFENSLSKLWLKWGGLATIDRTSPLFRAEHTGEHPASYHNGDSWFWVNNLAALVLFRLDKKKFKKYIDKILISSTKEILWQGTIGHHAELSSANKFKSEGCWAQAWSSALYIELVSEIFSPINSNQKNNGKKNNFSNNFFDIGFLANFFFRN